MAKLEKLTTEQENLQKVVRDEWIATALGGDSSIQTNEAQTEIAWLYKIAKLEPPRVLFVDSPMGAMVAAKLFGAKDLKTTAAIGIGYDAGWLSFYDFFARIGVLTSDNAKDDRAREGVDGLQHMLRLVRSGVWDCVLLERLAILSRRPEIVRRDERGRLHCVDGPSVRFRDAFAVWAWHGARLTERHIMRPESFTAEEILKEPNSETVRALSERLGIARFLAKLNTREIDAWTDSKTKLAYVLLETEHRFGDQQPRYLRMQSPPLNDGAQPTYFEPVPADIESAAAARKWQFAKSDGTWPTVQECNRDPTLSFAVER